MTLSDHVLLLTPAQINRLDMAQVEGRCVQIRFIARLVAKNISYTGGFIVMFACAISFVARALPTILLGITTGLLSGGINRAISGRSCWRWTIYINMINAIE